jgi:hypothetical protein
MLAAYFCETGYVTIAINIGAYFRFQLVKTTFLAFHNAFAVLFLEGSTSQASHGTVQLSSSVCSQWVQRCHIFSRGGNNTCLALKERPVTEQNTES